MSFGLLRLSLESYPDIFELRQSFFSPKAPKSSFRGNELKVSSLGEYFWMAVTTSTDVSTASGGPFVPANTIAAFDKREILYFLGSTTSKPKSNRPRDGKREKFPAGKCQRGKNFFFHSERGRDKVRKRTMVAGVGAGSATRLGSKARALS